MDRNNLLQHLLIFGIGTTARVADRLRGVSDEWVRTGRLDADQAKALIDELQQQLKSEGEELDQRWQRQWRDWINELGLARQSEVDELRGRIDRLERQLRALEDRGWR